MSEQINRAYFSIIPANVRYDEDLRPNAKLLYGEITALCNEKGYCWASNDYFAKLYNVSTRAVSKWISQLNKKGYISLELIYKDGTKEILNRYIRIQQVPIEQKFNTYGTKVHDPIEQKFHTPMEQKFQDNNTVINNTSNNKLDIYIVQIIDYFNRVCGTRYKAESKKTRSLIKARLKEKYTVDDFKKVIFTMYNKWKGTEWEQYLRPATLFNEEKFEGYLNQFKGGDIDGLNETNDSEQCGTGSSNKESNSGKNTRKHEDDITRALAGRRVDVSDAECNF